VLMKVDEEVRHLRFGALKVEVHPTRNAAGAAAAQAAAVALRSLSREETSIGVIFATGVSQLETVRALVAIPGLPWEQVRGLHLDEYVGLIADHPASFRHFLHDHLTRHVAMKEFCPIPADRQDLDQVCRDYAETVRRARPRLALLGVGENGHLAFNDPGEADFADPLDVKIVTLDPLCREQQVAEGWFRTVEEVPRSAITLTIPAILRVPSLIVTVIGTRKTKIMWRALHGPISPDCPASILRTHPDAIVYLDRDSAAALGEVEAEC
jgi:glucosamine-6-phosphate deaminase